MNDVIVSFLCSMLNQKKWFFYCPINRDPGVISEAQVPYHDIEVNEITKRHDLSWKDGKFISSRFGQDKMKPIEGSLCDWMN